MGWSPSMQLCVDPDVLYRDVLRETFPTKSELMAELPFAMVGCNVQLLITRPGVKMVVVWDEYHASSSMQWFPRLTLQDLTDIAWDAIQKKYSRDVVDQHLRRKMIKTTCCAFDSTCRAVCDKKADFKTAEGFPACFGHYVDTLPKAENKEKIFWF